jgi:hypothetical protein
MATPFAPAAPSAWFRIAAVLALLWNAFGLTMYLSAAGMFGDPMAGLDEAERVAAAAIPGWIMLAFALGTFAGFAGSIGLVLARRWAVSMLVLSAVALLVLEGWVVFVSGDLELHGLVIPLSVSIVAILLVLMAAMARKRGWLR